MNRSIRCSDRLPRRGTGRLFLRADLPDPGQCAARACLQGGRRLAASAAARCRRARELGGCCSRIESSMRSRPRSAAPTRISKPVSRAYRRRVRRRALRARIYSPRSTVASSASATAHLPAFADLCERVRTDVQQFRSGGGSLLRDRPLGTGTQHGECGQGQSTGERRRSRDLGSRAACGVGHRLLHLEERRRGASAAREDGRGLFEVSRS